MKIIIPSDKIYSTDLSLSTSQTKSINLPINDIQLVTTTKTFENGSISEFEKVEFPRSDLETAYYLNTGYDRSNLDSNGKNIWFSRVSTIPYYKSFVFKIKKTENNDSVIASSLSITSTKEATKTTYENISGNFSVYNSPNLIFEESAKLDALPTEYKTEQVMAIPETYIAPEYKFQKDVHSQQKILGDIVEAEIDSEDSQYYNVSVQILYAIGVISFGAEVFLTKFGTITTSFDNGTLEEYIATSIEFQLLGKCYTLNIEENTLTAKEGEEGADITLNSNNFIQNKYKDDFQNDLSLLFEEYKNGKTTATLTCAIGEYDDTDGNNIVSTKTSDKMVFEHYDEVVPMYKTPNGFDAPISLTEDYKSKTFLVLGSEIYFDGAVWQKLTLQEFGSVDIKDGTPSLTYELSDDKSYYICNGSADKKISNIVIGSVINGIPVKEIKYERFAYYQGYTNIENSIIPNTVKTVGSGAFMGLNTLKYISLGTSIETFSNAVFENCSGIEQIKFNSTRMNDLSSKNRVFKNAGKDGEGIYVTFGKNVERVPSYLFNSTDDKSTAPKIVNVAFEPNSRCESIGKYAFGYCGDLTSIEIPPSVKEFGEYAFSNNSKLSQVHIKNIAKWCNIDFMGSSSANPLYWSEKLYLNGKLVEQLVIPNTVYEINPYVFYYCTSFTSVLIPNNVKIIGEYAFMHCKNISAVYYMGSESDWNSIRINTGNEGLTNAPRYYYSETEPTTEGNYWHYVNGEVTVWENPNSVAMYSRIAPKPKPKRYTTEEGFGVEEYDYNAILYRYKGDEARLVLPSHINSKQYQIGDFAFDDSRNLEAISIPTSVTYIGESAFENCAHLKDVYYEGTRSQWNNIFIENGNAALLGANIHFNSFHKFT